MRKSWFNSCAVEWLSAVLSYDKERAQVDIPMAQLVGVSIRGGSTEFSGGSMLDSTLGSSWAPCWVQRWGGNTGLNARFNAGQHWAQLGSINLVLEGTTLE